MTNWRPITNHENEALESQNFGTGLILLTGKESSISAYAKSEPFKALTGLHVHVPAAVGGFYYRSLRLTLNAVGFPYAPRQLLWLSAITSDMCRE